MKTNDEGINRRNIPVKFMDYIAQTFGYETFGNVPKKRLPEVTETIKHRFSQTNARIRRPYAKKIEIIKRNARETALEFAMRVDNRDTPHVVTRISGTVPGDVTITQDYEITFTIPGDAEILGLSDLKPETVKQVAAELLEREKHREHVFRIARAVVSNALETAKNFSDLGYLKTETGQQWSFKELKNWGMAEKLLRSRYVFHEDRKPVFMETSNSTREMEIKLPVYTPDNWPAAAPPYDSPEGWEYQKAMSTRNIKSMLTIEWLEQQHTEKHASIAKRLREILAA